MSTSPITAYTGPTAEDLARIPAELTVRCQWILWRGADRVDTRTSEIIGLEKMPIDPHTLRHASTTDPATWGTFGRCVTALPVALEEWEHDNPGAYRGGGLGFVFTAADPYTGVDLDHCRDPEMGQVASWAQASIAALASYTEVTPSGTGVHVLVHGTLPPRGRKKGPVEMYNADRFFTMTGQHLAGTPHTITAHQEALYEVHGRVFGPQVLTAADGTTRCYCPICDYICTLTATGLCPACSTPPTAPQVVTPCLASTPRLDDAALLAKAGAAQHGAGARFTALYSGDWSAYASHSEADLGLCVRLAFWTQDPAQLDRLFRQSGLMRDKWDQKRGAHTYGERTLLAALHFQTTQYTPAQSPRPAADPDPPFHQPLPGVRGTLRSLQTTVRSIA